MAQQMFGGGALTANQGQATAPSPAPNPMAAMMQQMMSDPARMQQSMAMSQQLFGGSAPPTPAAALPITAPPASNPMAEAMLSAQRARFAGQLAQLVAMGFTNEAVCLRALAQHNGRVDAAIDACCLLAKALPKIG